MNYVRAYWAVFIRSAGEGMMRPPGPWCDTGIRAATREAAMAEWRARPQREQDWVESDLRLVEAVP